MSLVGQDLWFRHDRSAPWVLSGAGLDVGAGEVVGLRGPSGAGKSTLARALTGLLTPASGVVRVDGTELRGPDRRAQYLVQDAAAGMNPRWTVARLLAEAGEPTDAEESLVDPVWRDRYPHEISGGQLQRVSLARALRAGPAYLVADEITASLDALTQAEVWRDLLGLARDAGIGVLAVSHDAPLLDAVADRVVEFAPTAPVAPGR